MNIPSSNLTFTDTKDLKFSHTKDGVIAKYRNLKLILHHLSIIKKDILDKDQIFAHAKSAIELQCALRGWPYYEAPAFRPISPFDFQNDFSPFSKYVSNDIFENYIKHGKWQLGTIEQYRTIENKKQRDELEGNSFLNLNINDHMVSTICSSGFNYLIFCGTRSLGSGSHQKQFGNKELHFPNVRSFAEGVKKSIQAKRYFIYGVEYNTQKLYLNEDIIRNSEIDIENILSPQFFDVLKEHSLFPSLFVKPEIFSSENEIRIVFEMPKDYGKPHKFENKEILNYIKY